MLMLIQGFSTQSYLFTIRPTGHGPIPWSLSVQVPKEMGVTHQSHCRASGSTVSVRCEGVLVDPSPLLPQEGYALSQMCLHFFLHEDDCRP